MTLPDVDALAREAWQALLEKDDRTSPEEYPEMALITFEEFRDTLRAGWNARAGEEGPMVCLSADMVEALIKNFAAVCAFGGYPAGEPKEGWRLVREIRTVMAHSLNDALSSKRE